jgi:hypothetical protein
MAVNKPDPVRNLGHKATDATLTKNPLKSVPAYNGRDIISQKRSVAVYGKFRDPKDGTSSQENLSRWQSYAHSNSYDGKDPKGRGAGSDGHLAPLPPASTKNWADYRAGSESGEGRLEKLHRK